MQARVLADDLIDAGRVSSLSAAYGDLLSELIEIFAESTPAVLAALRSACVGADFAGVRAAAHNLKGASQNVGATFMADVARSIETDPSSASSLIDRLHDALDPTVDQLRAIFA